MATVERAIVIAVEAHAGQVDKAGQACILHPIRVMLAQTTDAARMVGALLDVVEDSGWSFEDLQREGFGQDVLEALEAVTRRTDESYEQFVQRSVANPLARSIKHSDLLDNSDLSRIANPTQKDHDRVARYQLMLSRYFQGGARP